MYIFWHGVEHSFSGETNPQGRSDPMNVRQVCTRILLHWRVVGFIRVVIAMLAVGLDAHTAAFGVERVPASGTAVVPVTGEHAAPSSTLENFARHALQAANASGFIHVRDVRSGRVLVHVSTSTEGETEPHLAIDTLIAPLSIIKVYVAASWLEHGFGNIAVDCAASSTRPKRRMLVDAVLNSSCDSAGAEIANILRQKLGAAQVLRDLRRYGLRDLTLRPDASDAQWGYVLSLGEVEVPVTAQDMSAFLRAIGQGDEKLVSAGTAHRLSAALDSVVRDGTADGIKDALTNTGWHIGGKTGTGPGKCGDKCDGWFASLVSDQQGGRYVILVFIRGKGLGGGLAARTAASMAEYLAVHQHP
jgi:cell division protein FtsI/penicillin-binding protein 2